MKAIQFTTNVDQGFKNSFKLIEKELPVLNKHDVLVQVNAFSVNPVDTKVRQGLIQANPSNILGWDAVGVITKIGTEVQKFKVGDEVWYAGDLTREGSNAEYQAVDERIISLKPKTISDIESAALPLTALTAWEMLFDRLSIDVNESGSILIIGGAGGVGSIAIQLLKAITKLTVIATASRPETQIWVKNLGADYVIDHHQNLNVQLEKLAIDAPKYVFSTTHTASYISQIADLIAPQGKLGLIDDPEQFDIIPFKAKSVSVHWELMFTRSLFSTSDLAQQGKILQHLANLVDENKVKTTLNQHLGQISINTLTDAHQLIESGHSQGKIVLSGFNT